MGRKRDDVKWNIVQGFIEMFPGASDRAIRAYCLPLCGSCSPTFVGKVRKAMEAEGRLPSVPVREGLDGRKRAQTPEEREPLRIEKARLLKERPKMKRGPSGFARRMRLEHQIQRGNLAGIAELMMENLVHSVSGQAESQVQILPLADDPIDPKTKKPGSHSSS